MSRVAILLSWLLTTSVVAAAIFSPPYMRGVLRGEAVEGAVESIGAFLAIAALCGWPWLIALSLAPSAGNRRRQYAFACIAFAISCLFYPAIANGQDFAIGLYTIICVLSIWLVYPVTRIIASK